VGADFRRRVVFEDRKRVLDSGDVVRRGIDPQIDAPPQ
jgi:hypothetical protein